MQEAPPPDAPSGTLMHHDDRAQQHTLHAVRRKTFPSPFLQQPERLKLGLVGGIHARAGSMLHFSLQQSYLGIP
jgi:hypothetical protein